MKESESTWRTTFTPVVTGDIEHETGFDDFDAVYLAHRPHIDDGVQALATFIRTHAHARASFQRNAGLFAIAREGCLSGLQRGS